MKFLRWLFYIDAVHLILLCLHKLPMQVSSYSSSLFALRFRFKHISSLDFSSATCLNVFNLECSLAFSWSFGDRFGTSSTDAVMYHGCCCEIAQFYIFIHSYSWSLESFSGNFIKFSICTSFQLHLFNLSSTVFWYNDAYWMMHWAGNSVIEECKFSIFTLVIYTGFCKWIIYFDFWLVFHSKFLCTKCIFMVTSMWNSLSLDIFLAVLPIVSVLL